MVAVAITTSTAPLAYVASLGEGSTRRRRDARLAAVLAEFGYRSVVGEPGEEVGIHPDRLDGVTGASVVVCDLVRPDRDVPVEVAIAATRDIPVVALVPAGVPIEGLAAQMLADARATIVRYDRAEPHHVLHARLAELEMQALSRSA
ncbi:MAG TPA: hypothetical protein VF549_16155 [Solirubrobacteraceae bacterium]|jgi:hypothetical protein